MNRHAMLRYIEDILQDWHTMEWHKFNDDEICRIYCLACKADHNEVTIDDSIRAGFGL